MEKKVGQWYSCQHFLEGWLRADVKNILPIDRQLNRHIQVQMRSKRLTPWSGSILLRAMWDQICTVDPYRQGMTVVMADRAELRLECDRIEIL